DEAHRIGGPAAADSYLQLEKIIQLAVAVGAEAIHPGYGFLSERPEFSEGCDAAGVVFVGPSASAMRALGSKLEARALAAAHGVPLPPGSGSLQDPSEAMRCAREIGFPVIVKPSGGGGGIGMKVVEREEELERSVESCRSAAQAAFGDPTVYVERYILQPRHIEIQIIADHHGNVVHLGERECSIQRRHQKILEETPSPAINSELRKRMGEAAVTTARAAGYTNAGTVEFVFSQGEFYLLEVNARLQVEHPVTETVTGIDLVKEQLRVAAGLPLSFRQEDIKWSGHAIEMRINAEDPAQGFIPNPRRISRWVAPAGPGVRIDSGFGPGSEIPPYYDSLVAKLIVYGADRAEAVARGQRALREYVLAGPATTLPYHQAILECPDFQAGQLTTAFIDEHPELLESMQRHLTERSPMDPVRDPRRIAAAVASVAAMMTNS
ncbi:MAG: acetyl-CoA carboxylase biotin carboxylase subunit, partial [Candidatus Dormibacteraceae bacterium]